MILDGAVDLHIHSAPCIFPRVGDDYDIAKAAKESGMRAIALKSHHESTVSRAYHVMQRIDGIDVIGGITLNHYVGGLNPSAVDVMFQQGGKIVWMPTADADYHCRMFGRLGSWGVDFMDADRTKVQGIRILDEDGKLLPSVKSIVEIVAANNGILCTSHISPEEIRVLVNYAASQKAKVVINHVYYMPRTDLEFLVEMTEAGATLEICAVLVFPYWAYNTFDQILELVNTVGAEKCIISTDAGGIQTPWPHDSLRVFLNNLLDKGLDRSAVEMMTRTNPCMLLGLS